MFNNPFAIEKFGANNPELSLIKDDEVKKQIQRQAMFKGLGQAGTALMNNAGQGAGKAFTAGANAFGVGSTAGVKEGIMVDEKRRAELAEQQRQMRMGDAKKHLSPMDQDRFQMALDTDNKALMTQLYEKGQKESLIAKVSPSSFDTKSVDAFRASVDAGSPDYGLLIPKENAGGGANNVSLYNLLYKQAVGQYGKYDPATGEFLILEGQAPKMQELYREAARMIAVGEADIGNAVSLAATKVGIDQKDLSKTKPKSSNTDFSDLEE